jgi:predicted nucleic acid-binding protein
MSPLVSSWRTRDRDGSRNAGSIELRRLCLYNCTGMEVVIDTSVIVAVLVREPHRAALIRATASADLLAPPSLHWEVGNAFSAMFKRRRLTLDAAHRALEAYRRIPIRFSDVELDQALELAQAVNVYAYDAYVLACAQQHRCALVSLDHGLASAATRLGIKTLEVRP